MAVAGAVELFFMVAATGPMGAEELAQRIREQLDSSEHIQQAGLTHSTSYRLLEVTKNAIKPNPNESMKDYLEKVAVELKELLQAEISRRIVKNGQ
jgi:hypothetical protein